MIPQAGLTRSCPAEQSPQKSFAPPASPKNSGADAIRSAYVLLERSGCRGVYAFMPVRSASTCEDRELDIRRVQERADDIEDKLPKLRQWMQHGKLMLALVKDYATGRYREVPYWAISAAALALLYVLNPVDVIPDILPGIGYLDDATVVAFCLKLMERELAKYQEWRLRQSAPAAACGGGL